MLWCQTIIYRHHDTANAARKVPAHAVMGIQIAEHETAAMEKHH